MGSPLDESSAPDSRAVWLLLAETGVVVSRGVFFSSGDGVADVGLGSLITISSEISFSMMFMVGGS